MAMPADTARIDSLQAKPIGAGWWYSNKLIRNINLMFIDLAFYKRKVLASDSVIMVQDTIITNQSLEITKKDRDLETSRNSEKQANFKAEFFEKFATKQQDLTIKAVKNQNKVFLIGGAIIGALIVMVFK